MSKPFIIKTIKTSVAQLKPIVVYYVLHEPPSVV